VDRASGFPGDPPLLPRGPLQGGYLGSSVVASVSYGSGVCGSKRLSKRVHGSFANLRSSKGHGFITGDCKGTVAVSSEACKLASLYKASRFAGLHPRRLANAGVSESSTQSSARKRSTTRVGGCQTVRKGGLKKHPQTLQRKRRLTVRWASAKKLTYHALCPKRAARGTKHYAQLKSNKKKSRVFFRAFLGRGRDIKGP
jgi:hypothetical protein